MRPQQVSDAGLTQWGKEIIIIRIQVALMKKPFLSTLLLLLTIISMKEAYALGGSDATALRQAIDMQYNAFYQQTGQVIGATPENLEIMMQTIGAAPMYRASVWKIMREHAASAMSENQSVEALRQKFLMQWLANKAASASIERLEDRIHSHNMDAIREHNKVWLQGFGNAYQ